MSASEKCTVACAWVLYLPLLSDRSCNMLHPVRRIGAHDLFRVEFCSKHVSVTYVAPPHIARVCWTQDHCVRVMKAEGSEVVFQASTDAAVGALCAFSRSGEGIDQVRARWIHQQRLLIRLSISLMGKWVEAWRCCWSHAKLEKTR